MILNIDQTAMST